MISGTTAAIIGAGAAIAGGTTTAFSVQKTNHKSRQFAREMYARQREDALADRDHAEEWALQTSDPAFLAERMRAAGYEYNPQGQAPAIDASVGQARASQAPDAPTQAPNFNFIGEAASAGIEAYNMVAQTQKIQSETRLNESMKAECIARTNHIISQTFGQSFDNHMKMITQNMDIKAKELTIANAQKAMEQLNQEVAQLRINNTITAEYARNYPDYWKSVRRGIDLDNVHKMYENKMSDIQYDIEKTYGKSNAEAFNKSVWQATEKLAQEIKSMTFFNSDELQLAQKNAILQMVEGAKASARSYNAQAHQTELQNKAVVMGSDGKTINAITAQTEANAERAIAGAQMDMYQADPIIRGIGTGCQIINSLGVGVGGVGSYINGMRRNQLMQQNFNLQNHHLSPANRPNFNAIPPRGEYVPFEMVY